MQGRLGWFRLRFTNNEMQELLKSARAYKVVSTPELPNLDKPVTGNVELTEDGKKLKPPRGASARDLGHIGVATTVLLWKAYDPVSKVVTVAAWFFGLLVAAGAWFAANKWWALAALLLFWWAVVLSFGWRGEKRLQHAANAWGRLKAYRRARWDFETHGWRHEFFPVVEWLVPALVALALLLGTPEAYWLGGAAAALVLLGVGVYWWRIRPLRDEWLTEARLVKMRRKAGRPAITAPPGVTEWPLVARKRRHTHAGAEGVRADLEADELGEDAAVDAAIAAAAGDEDELAPSDDRQTGGEL
jgi:hypothetical protein